MMEANTLMDANAFFGFAVILFSLVGAVLLAIRENTKYKAAEKILAGQPDDDDKDIRRDSLPDNDPLPDNELEVLLSDVTVEPFQSKWQYPEALRWQLRKNIRRFVLSQIRLAKKTEEEHRKTFADRLMVAEPFSNEQMEKDLAPFYDTTPSNPMYRDGYYAQSLERKYGMKFLEIQDRVQKIKMARFNKEDAARCQATTTAGYQCGLTKDHKGQHEVKFGEETFLVFDEGQPFKAVPARAMQPPV